MRNRIAAMDAATGLAMAWDPCPKTWPSLEEDYVPGEVNTLAVCGDVVYVGGSFSRIGGQWRPNFAQFGEVTAACTLTVQVEGQGVVDPPVGVHGYDDGAVATLTAMPAPGWSFAHWEGALTGSTNPATLLMNGDKTVKAVFVEGAANTRLLRIQVQGQGTVDPPEGTHAYGYGGVVTLTATPAPGWRFDRWEGAVTGAANPGTVVMTADRNVKAVFVPLGGGGSNACGATGKAAYACGMLLLWAVSRRRGKSPRRG